MILLLYLKNIKFKKLNFLEKEKTILQQIFNTKLLTNNVSEKNMIKYVKNIFYIHVLNITSFFL